MATYGTPMRPGASQTVAYTGTHGVVATAFGSQTRVVRVYTTTAGFVAFGSAPTATTADIPMAANVPEYFIVSPNSKVSAIQLSAGGNLYVTEMSY